MTSAVLDRPKQTTMFPTPKTNDRVRLAIVGSTKFAEDGDSFAWVEKRIIQALKELKPSLVISGGAKGIDTWAIHIAASRGFQTREFRPLSPQWEPNGYKDRNLLIAKECTHLLCIRHWLSSTYGSGWTADRAKELGKYVQRFTYYPHN